MVNTYTRMCDICKAPITSHTTEDLVKCMTISKMSYWSKDSSSSDSENE